MATIRSAPGRKSSMTHQHRRGAEQRSTDWLLVTAVVILTLLGLIMAYSTTFYWSYAVEGNPFTIFSKQLLAAAIGGAAFVVMSRIDYGRLRRWSVLLMLLCIGGLFVLQFIGATKFNARRSLFDGSIQPSELAKLIVLLYAATWLSSRRGQVRSFSLGLLPFSVFVGVTAALVATQPDISTASVILIAAAAMFFVAGASAKQIAFVGVVTLGAFFTLVNAFPHASTRLDTFIAALNNPQETHYHIQQALLAFGGGGLFGSGIGAGGQKFGLLPTPHTDSVFAVLGEEMGLIGIVVTLGLFVLLAVRSLRIAQRADTSFGGFLAVGIVSWVMAQMLLNVLAMTGLLPLPGVPVPFLSLGGSSLVSLLTACGILVSVSRGSQVLSEDDGVYGADETLGGRTGYRANTSIRRRNSGTRVARPHRVEVPEDDADYDIIGRDVRFTPQLGGRKANGERHRFSRTASGRDSGPLRWRTGGDGTGSRLPGGR
jgi:cell division protein FtsW